MIPIVFSSIEVIVQKQLAVRINSEVMKQADRKIIYYMFALILVSCDPNVIVNYNITNKTDDTIEVKIFGLLYRYWDLTQEYDTLIGQGQTINIYRLWYLGTSYSNPADTITIFDSLQVFKNSVKAKSDFKDFDTWNYTEKRYKYGGGCFTYELIVTSKNF